MKPSSTNALILTSIAVTLFCVLDLFLPFSRKCFVLNLSASVPKGIYRLFKPSEFHRGDLILFQVPPSTAESLGARRWLKPGEPLLKFVAALPGARVCITPTHVSINGAIVGNIFDRDSESIIIPRQDGCFVVKENAVFPLSTYDAHSFDGRYFGEVPLTNIQARAVPLFTWQ